MTTRSSSASSSSESELTSGRIRDVSETSRETGSRRRIESPTNTIDGTSLADTTTVRSASPTASQTSAAINRTGYDTVSIATTSNTGMTNATAPSQQSLTAGGIPIIRPPMLQQQGGTGVGVFGPQRPAGYPTKPPTTATGVAHQQPIQIDVAAAQQQYQQRGIQPEISPYSGSTSSSAGSLSSPGVASTQRPQQQQQQQPRFDAAKALFDQADVNRDGSVSREEFRQWAEGGVNQAGGQFQQQQQQQQQQAQFANTIPAHQVYNELLGPDAFKDVILDIDYGAMGGFNAAFQSGSDFAGGQLPPGINIRPAYTTVDSLNYQQHMFNTARTINAGGESNNYDFSGAGSNYNIGGTSNAYDVSGGQHFDAAKAIFNQADVNHDGSISRDEFRQWAQAGQQGYGGPSHTTAANYQTNYKGHNDTFYQASLFAGADPAVANILQQSDLDKLYQINN